MFMNNIFNHKSIQINNVSKKKFLKKIILAIGISFKTIVLKLIEQPHFSLLFIYHIISIFKAVAITISRIKILKFVLTNTLKLILLINLLTFSIFVNYDGK